MESVDYKYENSLRLKKSGDSCGTYRSFKTLQSIFSKSGGCNSLGYATEGATHFQALSCDTEIFSLL